MLGDGPQGINLLCLPPKMQAGHGVPRLMGELFMVLSLQVARRLLLSDTPMSGYLDMQVMG